MLIDLIQEVKEKGYKLRIGPAGETHLVQLSVPLFFSCEAYFSQYQTTDWTNANYLSFKTSVLIRRSYLTVCYICCIDEISDS